MLSRSGFAGIQRYAAVWSGDNQAKDEHILLGALLINQMGLSGVPFTGPDLGGYIGDGNKDLFRRWVEVGVFAPYLRNHRGQYTAANEPWAYGEEVEAISKAYIGFRYELMPYLYSTFHEASRTGMPVSRSLAIDYPFDANVYSPTINTSSCSVPALLVNPMTSQETPSPPSCRPASGTTSSRMSGSKAVAPHRGLCGSSDPDIRQGFRDHSDAGKVQSTRDDPGRCCTVHVFNGAERSEFVDYDETAKLWITARGSSTSGRLPSIRRRDSSRSRAPRATTPSPFRRIRLMLHGFGLRGTTVNGKSTAVQSQVVRMLDPLEALRDVYWDRQQLERLRQLEPMKPQTTLEFDDAPEIVVRWR